MEATKKKKISFILRLFQGLLIGVGGVLPGVSGGVLCIVFGIYFIKRNLHNEEFN